MFYKWLFYYLILNKEFKPIYKRLITIIIKIKLLKKLKVKKISIRKANDISIDIYFNNYLIFNKYLLDAINTVEHDDHVSNLWKQTSLNINKISLDDFLIKNNDILSKGEIDNLILNPAMLFLNGLLNTQRYYSEESRDYTKYYINKYMALILTMENLCSNIHELYIHSAKHQ